MRWCYALTGNYGVSIIVFTLFSKLVLLPVSVWVQKNSIKMVKMQPEINRIKVRHFGDADAIAEEQSALYKKEKYNPLASLVPLVIQLVLLVGVVAVVRDPGTYILHTGAGEAAKSLNMSFLGFDLTWVASENGGKAILVPILAAFSAWLLAAAQNAINVLQSEQSRWNKYGMMAFSVGLSLYLGFFVAAGVALYWIASNLLAIVQQYLLNLAINPKKYVNYEELRASEEELAALSGNTEGRKSFRDPLRRRSRADYKRFFGVGNKHLVFYSESSGFYKYYAGTIRYLLENTNIPIHYITSDPEDQIFTKAKENPQIHAYYIDSQTLIPLMMKMDADVVVMTMPDLENYQIKRSYVRKDVEYVYVPHGMDSLNMTMRTGSMDHFDAVLVCGKHQKEEIEKTEAAYGLPAKVLVACGYPLLDDMRQGYLETHRDGKKKILIAPSWQKDNIVDSCLDEMLEQLQGRGYQITVRPHPQHVRHMPEKMAMLQERFKADPDIEIQTDFSSNSTVFEADLMITDWSAIAYEYAFTTLRPVLFINTPMKVMNPEYTRIDTEPINIWMRERIGGVVDPDRMESLPGTVDRLLRQSSDYREKIRLFAEEYIYNPGTSGEAGARYLIGRVFRKAALRIKEKESRKPGENGKRDQGKKMKKIAGLLGMAGTVGFLAVNSLFMTSRPVQAYIDPSVMTYAIQAIAGIVIALGAVFGIYWRRIRKRLDGVLHLEEKRYKTYESDELCFRDPKDEGKILYAADLEVDAAELRDHAGLQEGRKNGPKSIKTGENGKSRNRFIPALFLTAAFAFLTVVYAPAELYMSNMREFWFDIYAMIPELLKLFLLIAAAGLAVFFVCYKVHRKLYAAVLALGLFAFLTLYVHGSFLAGNLPPLDGTTVDWSLYRGEEIRSLIVCGVILAVVVFLAVRLKEQTFFNVIKGCAVVVTLLLAVSLVSVCIKNDGLRHKASYMVTEYNEYAMSTDENFVILLLDAVDAGTFREVWEQEEKYAGLFEDFTFFENTLTAYPYTEHAVPFALTGEWMLNQEDYLTFETRALDNCKLFSTLEERGYEMGMYETELPYDSPNILRFANIRDLEKNGIKDSVTFAWLEAKLVTLKYAPYPLKKKGIVDMGYFENLKDAKGENPFLLYNSLFYEKLKELGITKMDEKCFRFIHLEGAHVPFKYAPDVTLIDPEEGSYVQNIQACLTLTEQYLQELKNAGVYDNSVIVIMADHGFNDGRYGENGGIGRQNPLLMIKGKNEKHAMRIDQAPISFEDLPEAWQRLLDGAQSDEVFDWKEGDERTRRMMFYYYGGEDVLEEYVQNGPAGDPDTLKPTGNVYRLE